MLIFERRNDMLLVANLKKKLSIAAKPNRNILISMVPDVFQSKHFVVYEIFLFGKIYVLVKVANICFNQNAWKWQRTFIWYRSLPRFGDKPKDGPKNGPVNGLRDGPSDELRDGSGDVPGDGFEDGLEDGTGVDLV